MHLEQEEFLRLARLAGLPPEAEDWEALKPALLEMEGFFSRICQEDFGETAEEKETAGLREDSPRPSLPREEALGEKGREGFFFFQAGKGDVT